MTSKFPVNEEMENEPKIPVDRNTSPIPPPPQLTEEQETKLWRKIDRRLMPILSLMYLMSFLDRGNIGNARLQGLVTELGLVGNQYNIALMSYFIVWLSVYSTNQALALTYVLQPYCIFEFPSNLVLKKFQPRIWLPGITILWGTV
ncbi:hypothetical protein V5O48_017869, partial [Marasmius crinis-equi]